MNANTNLISLEKIPKGRDVVLHGRRVDSHTHADMIASDKAADRPSRAPHTRKPLTVSESNAVLRHALHTGWSPRDKVARELGRRWNLEERPPENVGTAHPEFVELLVAMYTLEELLQGLPTFPLDTCKTPAGVATINEKISTYVAKYSPLFGGLGAAAWLDKYGVARGRIVCYVKGHRNLVMRFEIRIADEHSLNVGNTGHVWDEDVVIIDSIDVGTNGHAEAKIDVEHSALNFRWTLRFSVAFVVVNHGVRPGHVPQLFKWALYAVRRY